VAQRAGLDRVAGGQCPLRERTGRWHARIGAAQLPPAGALGHAVAGLFGADPKHEMDEDLMRMKALLETGKMPHDARQPVAPAAP
jgi:uncharacterized membrane protein